MDLLDDPRFSFSRSRAWRTWDDGRAALFRGFLEQYRGRPARFLEIGSFEGASAVWMLRNVLTDPASRLTCVDSDAYGAGATLEGNLAASGHASRTEVLWIESRRVREHLPDGAFDFVYVDGSHAAPNVLFDAVNAFLLCRPGGLIACDDYTYDVPEDGSLPREALDAFLSLMEGGVDIVHRGDQLWMRKPPLPVG